MPRMIEMMRQSAVPANVMRSAAKGALEVPPPEMIEILVYLTTQALFAEQAKLTLAGWDEAACNLVLGDPTTPWEVLEYFMAPQNRRPRLLPVLLENPSVREVHLIELAQTQSREIVDMLLASERAKKSTDVLHALAGNPHLSPAELAQVNALLHGAGESTTEIQAYSDIAEGEKSQYEIEHAAEIAAEEGKPFELVGGALDDEIEAAVAEAAQAAAAEAAAAEAAEAAAAETARAAAAETARAAAAAATAAPRTSTKEGSERISVLQKIARLTVGERVQLAMKGNKEERFILIRDGSKVVSSAVLESPKITDSEVETFAAMKNVQESVLRGITMKRKFMKNYTVIRALVNNPRCPLDLALALLNHLLVNDLKNLSMNKNVSDTMRKMALKLYRQKAQPAGGRRSD